MLNLSKTHSKLETFILEFFFIGIFAYMPSARFEDTILWAIAFLLFFAYSFIRFFDSRRVPIDKSIVWYVLFIFWGGASCIWAHDMFRFVIYLLLHASIIIASSICIRLYIQDTDDVDYIMKLMILAACFAGLRFSYYTPWDSIISSGYYMRGTFGSLLDDVTNYNSYTSHLCILTVIAIFYAIVKKVKWCRTAAILLFSILVFGGSRKNLVIIPLIAIFFALSMGSLSKKMRNLLVAIGIIILAFFALMSLDFLSQIRDTFFEMFIGLFSSEVTDQSTMERIYLIQSAFRVWTENFFIGVGWDNFRYFNALQLYAHNNYLELLACLGIVGFIIYYGFYVKIFLEASLRMVRGLSNEMDVLIIGILLSFLIQEYGSLTIYGREELIILLTAFSAYSFRKIKK